MQLNRPGLPATTLQDILRPASFYETAAAEPGSERQASEADFADIGIPECRASNSPNDPAEAMLALNVWAESSERNLLRADLLPVTLPVASDLDQWAEQLAGRILQDWS